MECLKMRKAAILVAAMLLMVALFPCTVSAYADSGGSGSTDVYVLVNPAGSPVETMDGSEAGEEPGVGRVDASQGSPAKSSVTGKFPQTGDEAWLPAMVTAVGLGASILALAAAVALRANRMRRREEMAL